MTFGDMRVTPGFGSKARKPYCRRGREGAAAPSPPDAHRSAINRENDRLPPNISESILTIQRFKISVDIREPVIAIYERHDCNDFRGIGWAVAR